MARGSVVDEPALIEALKDEDDHSAGLDVFAQRAEVPKELMEMDMWCCSRISARRRSTRATRWTSSWSTTLAWAAGKPPLTPVPGTGRK